mgnify:CR=1 FL=1
MRKEPTSVRSKRAEAEPDFPMIGLEGSSKFQTVGLYKASADLNSYLQGQKSKKLMQITSN